MSIKEQHIEAKTSGLPEYVKKGIVFFVLFRFLFVILSMLFETVPFICYDDQFIYNKIGDLTTSEILNKMAFRNNYYLISSVLNNFELNEYITGTRILNFFLMIYSMILLNKIAEILDFDITTRKYLTLMIVISPYYIIHSMVQLREVICLVCVLYLFYSFFYYEKFKKINWIKLIIVSVILYFTRTYVIEVFLLVFLFFKLRHSKWYTKFALVLFVLILFLFFVNNWEYMYVLEHKFEHYILDSSKSTGLLSKFHITGFGNLYNLFFLVPFVQLGNLPGAYQVEYYTSNSWANWLTFSAGIFAFNLPYFWNNIITIFRNKGNDLKKSILFFYFVFILIIAIAEPTNARFSFFITPIYFLFSIEGFVTLVSKDRKKLLIGLLFALMPYIYLLR